MDWRPFYRVLARHGLKRTHRYADGLLIYEQPAPDAQGVKLEVQLWTQEDRGRATHFHRSSYSGVPAGVADSYPTQFTTPQGLAAALDFERTRQADGVTPKQYYVADADGVRPITEAEAGR